MERAPVDLLGIPMEDTEEEPHESTQSAHFNLSQILIDDLDFLSVEPENLNMF